MTLTLVKEEIDSIFWNMVLERARGNLPRARTAYLTVFCPPPCKMQGGERFSSEAAIK